MERSIIELKRDLYKAKLLILSIEEKFEQLKKPQTISIKAVSQSSGKLTEFIEELFNKEPSSDSSQDQSSSQTEAKPPYTKKLEVITAQIVKDLADKGLTIEEAEKVLSGAENKIFNTYSNVEAEYRRQPLASTLSADAS